MWLNRRDQPFCDTALLTFSEIQRAVTSPRLQTCCWAKRAHPFWGTALLTFSKSQRAVTAPCGKMWLDRRVYLFWGTALITFSETQRAVTSPRQQTCGWTDGITPFGAPHFSHSRRLREKSLAPDSQHVVGQIATSLLGQCPSQLLRDSERIY